MHYSSWQKYKERQQGFSLGQKKSSSVLFIRKQSEESDASEKRKGVKKTTCIIKLIPILHEGQMSLEVTLERNQLSFDVKHTEANTTQQRLLPGNARRG